VHLIKLDDPCRSLFDARSACGARSRPSVVAFMLERRNRRAGGAVTSPAPAGGMKATTKGHALMNFQALQIALELIKALRPVIDKVGRSSKKEAEQMQDAANSIARNLAEGRRRRGKDRRYHWDVAAGSADEVRTSMLISLANGWLTEQDVEDAMALDDRVLAMTWRLTR